MDNSVDAGKSSTRLDLTSRFRASHTLHLIIIEELASAWRQNYQMFANSSNHQEKTKLYMENQIIQEPK